MEEPIFKQALAEALGTLALVFIGAGSVVWTANELGSNLVGTAFASGLVIMVMIAVFGAVSGAHFNPAVTLGMWLNGKIESGRAGVYVIAQLIGAILGAILLKWFIPVAVGESVKYGIPSVGHFFGTGPAQAAAVEAVLTFLFVLTIFAMLTDDENPYRSIAPLAVGGMLIACMLGGGPISGAALNPARWFGPALVTGNFTDWWVYIVGPLAGGVAAALLWGLVLHPKPKVTSPKVTTKEPAAE